MATYLIDYENTGVKGLHGIETLKEEDLIVIFYGPKTGAVPFDEHVRISSSVAHVEYFKTTKTAKNYLDFQLTTYLGYLVAQTGVKNYYVISKDSGYDSVIDFWRFRGIQIRRQENILNEVKTTTTRRIKGKQTVKSVDTVLPKQETKTEVISISSQSAQPAKKQITSQTTQPTSNQQTVTQTVAQTVTQPVNIQPQTIQDKKAITPIPENIKKKIRIILKPENLQGGTYKQIYSCMLRAKDKQSFNTALVRVFTQEEGNHYYKVLLAVFMDWISKKEN